MPNLPYRFLIFLLLLSIGLRAKASSIVSDSLELVASSASEDSTRINAMIALSEIYQTSASNQAYQYLIDALKICEKYDDDDPFYRNRTGRVLMGMGTLEIRFLDDKENAIKHINEAKECFASTGDFKHLAGTLMTLGIIHYYDGDYATALVYHQKALKNYEVSGFDFGIGGAYNNMGMTYAKLGQLEASIEAYRQSMLVNESIGAHLQTAQAANNIGALYNDLEEYELARSYFKKTLSIRQDLNDSFQLGGIYNNLGASYRHSNDPDSALWNCQQSIMVFEATGHPEQTINPTNNIGLVYLDQRQDKKAKHYFELAAALARTYNKSSHLALSLANLAVVYLFEEDNQRAIDLSLEALDIVEQYNIARYKLQIYDNLQKGYRNLGNLEKTIYYKDAWHAIKDSLNSIENKEIITRLESEYLAEQQQAEIEFHQAALKEQTALAKARKMQMATLIIVLILSLVTIGLVYRAYALKKSKNKSLQELNLRIQEQNHQIEEQSQRLQELNTHKDKLFSLVAHDLRGPFASVKSLIELIKYEDHPQLNEQLKSNFQHVYGLLENLLEWSRSQLKGQEVNKEAISLKEIIDETLALYQKPLQEKELVVELTATDDLQIEADRNMLLVIMRNLVSNAIKFSERKGRIDISVSRVEDKVEITIKDEGVGMNEAQISQSFSNYGSSTPGTENERGTGLGLALCQEFIDLHNGEMTCTSQPDQGTEIKLRFQVFEASNTTA